MGSDLEILNGNVFCDSIGPWPAVTVCMYVCICYVYLYVYMYVIIKQCNNNMLIILNYLDIEIFIIYCLVCFNTFSSAWICVCLLLQQTIVNGTKQQYVWSEFEQFLFFLY